jgi:hypothetical protein
VAVALVAIIIVGLLALFLQVQRAFRGGLAQKDVLEGGRAAMSVIARDLQELTVTSDPLRINFRCAPPALSDQAVQPLPGGGVRYNVIQDAVFVSRVNDDLIGVAYAVQDPEDGIGLLLRLVVTTNDSSPGGLSVLSQRMENRLARFRNNMPDAEFRPVLDGVLHLQFIAYGASGGINLTNLNFPPSVPSGYIFDDNELPAFLDVELGILEPDALERWRARQSVNPANARTYLEDQAARTHLFRQRVIVRSAASAF